MRCGEARTRINSALGGQADALDDRAFREHLANCPVCAREAAAFERLTRLLEYAATDDTADLRSLDEQRPLVEARARQATHPSSGHTADRPRLGRRLRYGGVLATAAIVLALISLVPYDSGQTLGYAVAFGGVDRDLAQDNERICDLLYVLGLDHADIDHLDCDTTCRFMIVDLASEAEAHLVVTAFNSLSEDGVTSNVIPITDDNGRIPLP